MLGIISPSTFLNPIIRCSSMIETIIPHSFDISLAPNK